MELTIDFLPLIYVLMTAAAGGPFYFFWFFLQSGGWLIIALILLETLFQTWLILRRRAFLQRQKYILLAIDVPKDNEQSLKAVEYIFSSLHSTRSRGTIWQRLWEGRVPLAFSFEIVSLEGYIQYLIRTPKKFQDLIEAAVYSQYPEAEITEVEDYINLIPKNVGQRDAEYKLFGTEFVLAKSASYPLKVYPSFEHSFAKVFADPLAGLLEVFSKLKKGEQAAYQLVVRPTADSWKGESIRIVKKLIGAKVEPKKGGINKIIDSFMGLAHKFPESIYFLLGGEKEEKKGKDEIISKMLYLSPGEKSTVEAIENKVSKLGFKVKMRVYYLAPKSLYSQARGVTITLSPIKQFDADNNLKAFKKLFTIAEYFFIEARLNRKRRRLIKLFKERNSQKAGRPMILGSEELATLYHFPTIGVKTALVKTIESKKAEAPVYTPFEESAFTEREEFLPPVRPPLSEEKKEEGRKVEYLPPDLRDYDFSNKYYEEKFAKEWPKTITPRREKMNSKGVPPANLPIEE